MCAVSVVIVGVGPKDAGKMSLIENDEAIEAFAPDRSDDAFHVRVLPRRSWRGSQTADGQRAKSLLKLPPKATVTVVNKKSGCGVPRERFIQLLCGPLGCWVSRDGSMDDPSPIVIEHDHAKHQFE